MLFLPVSARLALISHALFPLAFVLRVLSCNQYLAQGDCRVIALSETTREQVVQSINLFLASMIYRVLIVSYEVQ